MTCASIACRSVSHTKCRRWLTRCRREDHPTRSRDDHVQRLAHENDRFSPLLRSVVFFHELPIATTLVQENAEDCRYSLTASGTSLLS